MPEVMEARTGPHPVVASMDQFATGPDIPAFLELAVLALAIPKFGPPCRVSVFGDYLSS